jgi:ParB family chromosome partitioning protein
MEKKKDTPSRLGRGLSALIPPTARPTATVAAAPPAPALPNRVDVPSPAPLRDDTSDTGADQVLELPIAAITPNTFQPRTAFDEAALEDLAASIATHGVLQPIMVRASGRGRYELIAGERRFRAAERAGLTRIPAIVRDVSDEESLVVALIENIQREDLNAIEAARGYRQLLDQFRITQTELSRQIGKGLSTVSNSLRLLELPVEIQESMVHGKIKPEHGKVLLSVPDKEKQLEIWRKILEDSMTISALYAYLDREGIATTTKKRTPLAQKDVHWQALEDQFRTALGMKIELKPGRTGRGTLTIEFSNDEEVEDLLAKLNTY